MNEGKADTCPQKAVALAVIFDTKNNACTNIRKEIEYIDKRNR